MGHTRIAFGIGHTPCGIGRVDPVVLVYGLLVYFVYLNMKKENLILYY